MLHLAQKRARANCRMETFRMGARDEDHAEAVVASSHTDSAIAGPSVRWCFFPGLPRRSLDGPVKS